MLGEGFYFTNQREDAENYASRRNKTGGQAFVMPVFLNLRKPLTFHYGEPAESRKAIKESSGHDGVIHKILFGSTYHYVALNPNQIKSATDNSGAFDGSNPDISMSVRNLASMQDSDAAFSLRSLEAAARAPFAARADEAESVEILKRLDQLEAALRLGSIAGDESLGSGAAQLASIISLLEAVKGVLPPEYSRMGNLNVSLKWASVYAEMVEKGEIPRGGRGVLSGTIAQKFLASMTKKKEGLLLQGVSEEEAKRSLNPFTNIKRMSKEGAYSLMNYNQLMQPAFLLFC